MIGEEIRRLLAHEERHRRLYARLALALVLTLVVFAVGTLLVWLAEAGHRGATFTASATPRSHGRELLTVSSSLENPLTSAGKVIDIALGRCEAHLRDRGQPPARHRRRRVLRARSC